MVQASLEPTTERAILHLRLAGCSLNGTIIGTVISASYSVALQTLAISAMHLGFACVAVQPMYPGFPWAQPVLKQNTTLFQVLPDPPKEYLPRELWCQANYSSRYGWRRVHSYKMHMWVSVLSNGYDLFSMDADWSLVGNPFAILRASHHLIEADRPNSSYSFERTKFDTQPADFVALLHDGYNRRQLNIGVVFIRSSQRTINFARTVFNRSFAAQDQVIVNEELNFGHHNVSCCFSFVVAPSSYSQPLAKGCDAFQYLTKDPSTHVLKNKELKSVNESRMCATQAQTAPASRPPVGSAVKWSSNWNAAADNVRRGTMHYGRCTKLDNRCGCVFGDK